MMLKEWVIIAIVAGFLASISIIAHFSESSRATFLKAENRLDIPAIQVTLTGAVKRPGTYSCLPGSSLKSALQKAGLSPHADRKKIQLKKVIYTSQRIEIPSKIKGEFGPEKISFEEK